MTALTDLLTTAAGLYPDTVAVADDRHELTHTELSAAVAHTAARLREANPGGGPVLLALAPGTEWVTALLSAWHAGRPAVPVDVTHPPERLRQVAAGCRATAVVTSTGTAPAWAGPLTALAPATGTAPPGTTATQACADEDRIACIWHTSGSTGAPKPVLVSHRALAARAAVLPSWSGLTAGDRVAQLTALTFDAVLWEVLGALTAGARLQIAAPRDRVPGPALPLFLRRREITAFTTTPTCLAAAPFTELPRLRRIVLGGEALHPGPLKLWSGRYDVANAYGPTETCIDAIVAAHIRPGEDPVPIGRPLPGVRAWVLDARRQPVPAGEAGELYLGGQGLATGYLDRPEETARAFLSLSLPDGRRWCRERVYRTGDRVRQLRDGRYVFLGRDDGRLNLGGVRLEPGEVERTAAQAPGVRAAVLLTDRATSGRPRLVLHVETDDPGLPSRLRKHLADRLAPSAVPALILGHPSLPRTASGKIDRLTTGTGTGTSTGAPDSGAPVPPLPEDVARWWREQTGAEADGARDFFAAGGDSLAALLLLQQVNERYGTEISLDAFHADPTTRFLHTALNSGSTP